MNKLKLLDTLANQLMNHTRNHPLKVAVDGIDAAGKTTLADELAAVLESQGIPVIRASIDGFHNPREIRRRRSSLSPDGYYNDSFNYDVLKKLLLEPLGAEGSRQYKVQQFDYRMDNAAETPFETAEDNTILLFDGVFLMRPELNDYWDVRIFVDVSFETALERAHIRDLPLFGSAAVIEERYRQRYFPAQRHYLNECDPKGKADIVIDNRDPHSPVIGSNRLTG